MIEGVAFVIFNNRKKLWFFKVRKDFHEINNAIFEEYNLSSLFIDGDCPVESFDWTKNRALINGYILLAGSLPVWFFFFFLFLNV